MAYKVVWYFMLYDNNDWGQNTSSWQIWFFIGGALNINNVHFIPQFYNDNDDVVTNSSTSYFLHYFSQFDNAASPHKLQVDPFGVIIIDFQVPTTWTWWIEY